MTHQALVARLEGVEAGSRELDGGVYRFLFPDDLIMTDSGSAGPVKRDAVRQPVKEIPHVPSDVIADCMGVPRYTTSLDAALSLAERVLGDGTPDAADVLAEAVMNLHAFCFHADKPLAPQVARLLCIAILRAKGES